MKTNKPFNLRKTAVMTSLSCFLWLSLVIAICLLLEVKGNAVVTKLLTIIYIMITPIMLYSIIRLDKLMDEK